MEKQLSKLAHETSESLGFWECEIVKGAIKTAPSQSLSPRKKQWASIITGSNAKAPGGKNRIYLKPASDGFLYEVKDLKPNQIVEFVADCSLGSDLRVLTKVLEVSDTLVLEILKETKTKNLSKTQKKS